MRVDGIHGTGGVSPKGERSAAAARKRSGVSDAAEFRQIEAIQKALDEIPAIRPEALERGLKVFNDAQYPPMAVIDGIARLLADRIRKGS